MTIDFAGSTDKLRDSIDVTHTVEDGEHTIGVWKHRTKSTSAMVNGSRVCVSFDSINVMLSLEQAWEIGSQIISIARQLQTITERDLNG